MNLVQKLKQFEKQVVFLRWAGSEGYGRINYVGSDYMEFEVLDVDSMEYSEIVLINAQLILEVVISGYDVSRVLVEYSSTLPESENNN